MIWLKVPGVVRPYLWGVGGMTIDELNESCICHQVRFEAEEGRWVAIVDEERYVASSEAGAMQRAMGAA